MSSRENPVVLLDVNLQSLSLIRALGRRGVPIVGVTLEPHRFEHSSRYVEIVRAAGSDPASVLSVLAEVGSRPGPTPVLLPMNDDMTLFASEHRHLLSRNFRLHLSPHDVLTDLVSKDGMARRASEAGVDQPGCWSPDRVEELQALIGEMNFPVLVKPRHSPDWQRPEVRAIVTGKVGRAEEPEELLRLWIALRQVGSAVVVQEEVPGDDTQLVYYVGYFDEESRPLASFTGTKLRVLPNHYGSASAAVSHRYDEVIRVSEAFMRSVGYRGHVGIEYKIDPRDDRPMLIEVNARWGLWDGLGARCGMDFAWLGYRFQCGERVEPVRTFSEGQNWVSFGRDLWAVGGYRDEGSMTRAAWIRDLVTQPTQWAVWALDDPLPFLGSSCELVGVLLGTLGDKLRKALGFSARSAVSARVPVPSKR